MKKNLLYIPWPMTLYDVYNENSQVDIFFPATKIYNICNTMHKTKRLIITIRKHSLKIQNEKKK